MVGRTRVLLVDDHPLVRAGVRRVLEGASDIEVLGEASDGAAALEAMRELRPDVVILDLGMPGMDGVSVLRRARLILPAVKILVLTMHASPEYVALAIQAGADGYLLKESAVQELLVAIQTVVAGRAFHSPQIQLELARLVRNGADGATRSPELDRLSDRERDVLRAIAEGSSTKEIAGRFGISTRTVETHRASVMRKLGLRSVALLTQFAIRVGLVRTP
jgi:DNA-binding NarL/FixJ family response regulator